MNNRLLHTLLFAFVFCIALISCKKEKEEYKGNYSKAYFPLQINRFVVYDVDSTIWDDFFQVKTLHRYQMRYTIADTFSDNQKRLSYRVDVHIRRGDTLSWKAHRVIYVTPTETHLEYVEANIRFIKLVFPISEAIEWKGNSMIPSGDQDLQYFQDWTYRYKDFTQKFNNGKVLFDNTVTVTQIDVQQNDPETIPDAYSFKTFGKEVYAYNVGMVYREITHWTYDPSPGQPKFRKGYGVVMRAVDHN